MATRAAAARRMDEAKKAGQKMSSPSKSAPNRSVQARKGAKGPGLLLPQDYAMAPSPPNTLYRPIEEPIGNMHWKLKAPKGEPWQDWDQAASAVVSAKGAARGVRASAPGAGMPKRGGGPKPGGPKGAAGKKGAKPAAAGAPPPPPPELRRFSVGKGAKGHGWSGVSRPADFAMHMDEVDDYYGGLPLDAGGRVMLRPDVRPEEGTIPSHLSNGPIAASTVMEQPQWPAAPDGPVGRFARAGPGPRGRGGGSEPGSSEAELLSEIASESMAASPRGGEVEALRKQRENAAQGRTAALQQVEAQRAQMAAMQEKIDLLQVALHDARGLGASAAGTMEAELARAHGLVTTPGGRVADAAPLAITQGGGEAGREGEGGQEQWATPRQGSGGGASRGSGAGEGAGSEGAPGPAPGLPDKVQTALDELAALEGGLELALPPDDPGSGEGGRPGSRAGRGSGAGSSGHGSRLPSRPGSRGSRAADLAAMRKLEERVDMSRNIMRKLYRKNVELEKENQLLRAQRDERPPAAAPGGGGAAAGGETQLAAMPGEGVAPTELPAESPVFRALQEKDARIHELDDLLGEARERILALERTMAEAAVVQSVTHVPPRTAPGRGGAVGMRRQVSMNLSGSLPPGSIVDGLRQAVAESTTHFEKYRQIRSDYRRLLNRRVESVRRATGASNEAKKVVVELRERLSQEVRERETEASLFNSRLYEAEKRQSDWFVERRLLEQKVARLDGEVRERDRLDAQIESCVTALFERMRLLERANQELTAQLGDIGLVDAHAARAAAVAAVAQEDAAAGGDSGVPSKEAGQDGDGAGVPGQTGVPERGGADVYTHEPMPATPLL